MGDTQFIKRIDEILKEHYGNDFQWKSIFVSNFKPGGLAGHVSIDVSGDHIEGFSEFLDEKIETKAKEISRQSFISGRKR